MGFIFIDDYVGQHGHQSPPDFLAVCKMRNFTTTVLGNNTVWQTSVRISITVKSLSTVIFTPTNFTVSICLGRYRSMA